MRSVRPLLAIGNGKLGQSIHHFDLPAVSTCPGRSCLCEDACYARQGRFRTKATKERMQWCYEQSLEEDFALKLTGEIRRKGVLVVRLHVSGDFYDAAYAAKWLEVMRKCHNTRFYFYSRSWRETDIAPYLERMARLKNCKAWYSIDDETGVPSVVPLDVRLAYLQVEEEDSPPEVVDLMFRVRSLRRQAQQTGLPLICPNETPQGKTRQTNCGNCGHCWND